MCVGKEGHTNVQISAEPGIEPGDLVAGRQRSYTNYANHSMCGGKEGHTNVQISAEPGIEPGDLVDGRQRS